MAVGRHFENGFIAITQPGIIRFQRNLVCSRKLRFQGRSHDKVPQFCKFNMADGRHNDNRFFGYISTIICLINAKSRTTEQYYAQTQFT